MLAIKTLIPEQVILRRKARFMGTRFEIGAVCDNALYAEECITSAFSEISRVEKLLSVFNGDSAVNLINRNAGVSPVKISAELFRLINRLLQISELTCGTFDITYSAPEREEQESAVAKKLSYKHVVISAGEQTVFLKHKGMRIGFGAIIKGYAADRAKYVLQMKGIGSGVINFGGDLLTWGLQPDMEPWNIAAADQAQKGTALSGLNISNMALAISVITGNNTTVINKQLLNIIGPESGFQVSGIKSLYVLSTTAEMAAAMATPLNALGINAGLYLVNRLNQVACIFNDDQNRVYASKGLSI